MNLYLLLNKIEDEDTKENIIVAASYILENNVPLNEANLLYYAEPKKFKTIQKEIKSIKKLRKNTNTSIIRYYGN
jgi:hypothetical protein